MVKISRLCVVFLILFHVTPARAQQKVDYTRWSDQQLEEELDRQSLGGPISVLAVGGGILVGTLFMTLVALSAAEMCSLHQMQSYYYYDQPRKDCFNERRYLSVAGTAVAVGGGMALGGGLWLGDRAAKRKPIKAELEARHPELSWRLDVRPARGGSTLGVQLTF